MFLVLSTCDLPALLDKPFFVALLSPFSFLLHCPPLLEPPPNSSAWWLVAMVGGKESQSQLCSNFGDGMTD